MRQSVGDRSRTIPSLAIDRARGVRTLPKIEHSSRETDGWRGEIDRPLKRVRFATIAGFIEGPDLKLMRSPKQLLELHTTLARRRLLAV
jgi:hypothetical protein